jgi:hypothetical protein
MNDDSSPRYPNGRTEPPAGYRQLHEALKVELVETYAIWNVMMELFNAKAADISLMNKHGRHFFVLLERTYLDHVVLRIGHLLDPSQTRGKHNMCLARLCDLLNDSECGDLALRASTQLKKLKETEEPLRVRRNRHIAHKDLNTSLQIDALPNLYISTITQVLKGLAEILNSCSLHYDACTTAYDGLHGAGTELLKLIEMADQHYICETRLLEAQYGITLPEPEDDAT